MAAKPRTRRAARPPGFPFAERDGPPVVLVTGCSSGIGLAIARALHEAGLRVAATSPQRSLPQLRAQGLAEGPRLMNLPLDLERYGEARAAVEAVEERWGGVDVLINNAGVSYRAALEEMTEEDEQRQQQVNYLGAMRLTRMVLPGMRAHRWGRIVNVSSVSGMMSMPTMGSYSASKWALEGASEALWYEVRPWQVKVSIVQIGFVNSPSFWRVLSSSKPGAGDCGPYADHYRSMAPFVEKLMTRARATPESIAERIVRLLGRREPPLRIAATNDARLFYLLRRLLPRRLYHAVLYHALPGASRWGRDPD